MRVAIFEDEAFTADHLENMLKTVMPSIIILTKITTIRKGIEWLSVNTCDLIFLDVNLADGLSFKIFEQVKVNIPIVFTTAYDQYAVKAFELNSIDYLLKPISVENLRHSLDKYAQMVNSRKTIPNFEALLETLTNPLQQYRERFMVEVADKIRTIQVEDIAYFYAMQKNTFFTTKRGETYNLEFSLDRIEPMLNPKSFFRISRSYIVNIKAIEGMNLLSNRSIKLTLLPATEEMVTVSLSRLSAFKEWLNQ